MEITKAQYIGSFVKEEDCPQIERPEYAFIGRSNVGKSSLINMLTGRKSLALVSGKPGKTQTINYFLINETWGLVDLPGYGFAKASKSQRAKWKKMINNFVQIRRNLVTLFVLVDGRHGPQKNDIEFINLLGEWQIPFVVLFTKTDKVSQRIVQKNKTAFFEEMKKYWTFLPAYFLTSALKGRGRDKVLEYIHEYNLRFNSIA